MPDRTKATPVAAAAGTRAGLPRTASTAGILRPEGLARCLRLERHPAGPGVAAWVENHWSLAWDLPPGTVHRSETLPHPACSLTVELADAPRPGVGPDPVVVTGVVTRRFAVDLRGRGRVVGVKFRPGGLAALTGREARSWTDRVLPAREVLPGPLCDALADPRLAGRPRDWVRAAEAGLGGIPAPNDPTYRSLLDVVADMLADRTLLTVAEAARRHGVSVRTLQRVFTHYVGVGPKWVLARYRMHDVVAALDAGDDGTLTDLAVRFGWYDQAHFTRDFVALVGATPGQYRARPDGPAAPPRTAE